MSQAAQLHSVLQSGSPTDQAAALRQVGTTRLAPERALVILRQRIDVVPL